MCGAKWCQIRQACSRTLMSGQNGHRLFGGRVFGEQDVRWERGYVRPREGMVQWAEDPARVPSYATSVSVPAEEVGRLLREWARLDHEDPS